MFKRDSQKLTGPKMMLLSFTVRMDICILHKLNIQEIEKKTITPCSKGGIA